jgi:endonuclease/exonuclease/phosphatase family metal-dependent hydrolase
MNQDETLRRIRLVTWNIEKGKRWELLEKCLDTEWMRTADILCLNEVDEGMARSGNRRIAYEIGERLGMEVVFGQTYKELTKGIGEERLASGENTTAIQGNATLCRLPIFDSSNLRLPVCNDASKRDEKREGGRHALVVTVDCGKPHRLSIVNTHLEVFTTTRCRRRQMRFILEHIDEGPTVITGDFNTNTFARGSAFATFKSVCQLLRADVNLRAMNPTKFEGLFRELSTAGFCWDAFNDIAATCSADLSSLEDQKHVPAWLRNRILSRSKILPLRLDFIAARGVKALTQGRTITGLPGRASDHLPITCDIWFT